LHIRHHSTGFNISQIELGYNKPSVWSLVVVGSLIVGVGMVWVVAPSIPWLGENAENCMTTIKSIFKWLLALLMLFAGVMHFVRPGFFLKIMPPYLPLHLELVYMSGVFEIGLGICLLIPRFSRFAAWGIIALLIAVFPANIYVYQHQEIVPASRTVHFIRLLFQGVLILIAYWQTRNTGKRIKTTNGEEVAGHH